MRKRQYIAFFIAMISTISLMLTACSSEGSIPDSRSEESSPPIAPSGSSIPSDNEADAGASGEKQPVPAAETPYIFTLDENGSVINFVMNTAERKLGGKINA